jgi:long-subunit fatty acid transport protein
LLLIKIGLITTLFVPSTNTQVHEQSRPNTPSPVEILVKEQSVKTQPALVYTELELQIKTRRVMPVAYWEDVAHCETDATRRGWKDGGQYAGGLGIYVGTWRTFGGTDFAPTPNKATKAEQITIANRITVFGHKEKGTVSYFGWGCIRNHKYLHPDVWLKKHKTKIQKAPKIK